VEFYSSSSAVTGTSHSPRREPGDTSARCAACCFFDGSLRSYPSLAQPLLTLRVLWIAAQVLLNMLLHGMDPQAALDAPRLLLEPAPPVHALNAAEASRRCGSCALD
jgi:hypothetical protein